jgi:hypothetical protein
VPADVGHDGREERVRVPGALPEEPVGGVVEGSARVPGLGEPVGVQQQAGSLREGHGVGPAGIRGQHGQAQRQCGPRRLQGAHRALEEQQRRRVPSVDQTHPVTRPGDLGQYGGGEVLDLVDPVPQRGLPQQ